MTQASNTHNAISSCFSLEFLRIPGGWAISESTLALTVNSQLTPRVPSHLSFLPLWSCCSAPIYSSSSPFSPSLPSSFASFRHQWHRLGVNSWYCSGLFMWSWLVLSRPVLFISYPYFPFSHPASWWGWMCVSFCLCASFSSAHCNLVITHLSLCCRAYVSCISFPKAPHEKALFELLCVHLLCCF